MLITEANIFFILDCDIHLTDWEEYFVSVIIL